MRTAAAGSGGTKGRIEPGTTFADLVRERLALGSPRKIGEALWLEFGGSIFDLLPKLAPSLLAEQARHVIADSARNSVKKDPVPVIVLARHVAPPASMRGSVSRIAGMHRSYWSEQWHCEDGWKATRDLTVSDLRWLIAQRTAEMQKNRAWACRFETWLNQARQHGVKILGDLEKKGIDLLDADDIEGGDHK